VLVELSVMEQRYQAVLAVVQDGWKVVEVARRTGVSRQTLHGWIARYEAGGLSSLADRSHRPDTCSRDSTINDISPRFGMEDLSSNSQPISKAATSSLTMSSRRRPRR